MLYPPIFPWILFAVEHDGDGLKSIHCPGRNVKPADGLSSSSVRPVTLGERRDLD